MSNPYGWGDYEPQIKPKDQGGDTVATFSQKVYNLFNTLFDTLNSYPWSTATQIDAGYMSAEDKAALDDVPNTYLPLAGGTLSGTITFTPPASSYLIRRADNDGTLIIVGGSTGQAAAGAKLYLNGSGYSSNPGRFCLQAGASDGTYKQLAGLPDGTLTWDGKGVERVRASGTDYICYESGLQICWGYVSSITVNAEKTINFGRAFADTNTVVLITRRSGASSTTVVDEAWIRGTPTTTSFGLYATTQTGYTWIAIGKGAA